MSILLITVIVLGGLLTAFLYPRNVDISVIAINSSNDYIDSGPNLYFGSDDSEHAILEIAVKM